jgi:peptidoglycan/LPS O-acetylase OafA/YrhL
MIFFVLSGFLVSRILIGNQKGSAGAALKNFIARRALRIFPLYYLAILVFSQIGRGFGSEFIYHITYTTNFHIVNNSGFLAPHFWSLAVEEQFYLLLPLILLFTPPQSYRKTTLVAFLIGVFFRAYYHIENLGTHDRLLWSNLDALGLGIMLALFEKQQLRQTHCIALAITPLVLSLVLKSTFLLAHNLILALTVLTIFQLNKKQDSFFVTILEFKPIKYLGTISYGIYVWHFLFWQNKTLFMPLKEILVQLHPIMAFGHGYVIVIAIITLLASVVSYELFEKRILKLKRFFT